MSMQLQHTNGNKALATEAPADYIPVAGIEKLSPEDFSIPVMKLVQTNTNIDSADTLAGQWYRTDTGEVYKTVKILIIGIAKSRILFKSEYAPGAKALCRSDDSIAPRTEFIGQMIYYLAGSQTRKAVVSEAEGKQYDTSLPATCAECPLSQWGLNGEKPPCRLSDNWASLTEESDPVLIRFSGSSAPISAKLRNLARAAAAKRRPLYVELSSHFEEGDESGKYYIPDLTLLKEALPADLLDTAKAFNGLNLAARAAEMMSDDEEPTRAAPTTRRAEPNDGGPDWLPQELDIDQEEPLFSEDSAF